MIVIIPCGGKKREDPCPAGEMYVGSYHLACQRYALSLAPRERVFILSAKYGLLALDETIEPYDLRMGQEGSVKLTTLLEQARALEILCEDDVVAIGGADYVKLVSRVWPSAKLPLKGAGPMGHQMKWLKERTDV